MIINFNNPFNGRRWLKLLKEDSELGIVFKSNLDIEEKEIGFSFKSNKYGLRGDENSNADIVLLGTSFAMGLSVNNSKNWYELSSYLNHNYFNGSMPVGFYNFEKTLNKFYRGKKKTLVFLYHPNQLPISISYNKIKQTNQSAFKFFNWKTDFLSVLKYYFKWKFKLIIKKLLKKELTYKYNKVNYIFNKNYVYLDFDENKNLIDIEIEKALNLFKQFDEVFIFKIPIKEEVVLKEKEINELRKLKENYDERWEYFKNHMRIFKIIDLSESFLLSDYLPEDTHWSELGNKKFSNILDKLSAKKNI